MVRTIINTGKNSYFTHRNRGKVLFHVLDYKVPFFTYTPAGMVAAYLISPMLGKVHIKASVNVATLTLSLAHHPPTEMCDTCMACKKIALKMN